MQKFPHRYVVVAAGNTVGDIELASDFVPPLPSAPPAEFDGPGDRWSPETLLVGAVADCFVLTFRAIARASATPWTSLRCHVSGTLERVDNAAQFTRFDVHACLSIPPTTDAGQAGRALERAKSNCLISNSLKAATHLTIDIDAGVAPPEPADIARGGE
jgi:organic hydroperoxide reductase OsmC/OhrA